MCACASAVIGLIFPFCFIWSSSIGAMKWQKVKVLVNFLPMPVIVALRNQFTEHNSRKLCHINGRFHLSNAKRYKLVMTLHMLRMMIGMLVEWAILCVCVCVCIFIDCRWDTPIFDEVDWVCKLIILDVSSTIHNEIARILINWFAHTVCMQMSYGWRWILIFFYAH